jgi:hypothetical protein
LALVIDIGIGMSQAAPGFDSPLQITSDILQMIVQRKVENILLLFCLHLNNFFYVDVSRE